MVKLRDHDLTAPQHIVIMTATQHSILYLSHSVTPSLDTASRDFNPGVAAGRSLVR